MNILVVGAGALGGYYGGRLLQAGQKVTFLLRPNRIKQLQASAGLHIKSHYGDVILPDVPYIQSEQIDKAYDLIIVSCKAYDLDACMDSFAAAVGSETMILPVLNGIQHIDRLSDRFGKEHILGGLCLISATLNEQGHILHLNQSHSLLFGELSGEDTSRIQKVKTIFEGVNFNAKYSNEMMQELWNKWIFIATIAGSSCLFRAAICDVIKAQGAIWISKLLDECVTIADHYDFKPNEKILASIQKMVTDPESELTASIMKDIEKQGNIESEAIIGNFIQRIPMGQESQFPVLQLVYVHLNAYLARKQREAL